jgi:hypothetical protein
MNPFGRLIFAFASAALACLALGSCTGASGVFPHAIADAQPPPGCPPKICPTHPPPEYTFTPTPTGGGGGNPTPPPGSTGKPKSGSTKQPSAGGGVTPGSTATAPGAVVTGPAAQPTRVGVFAFGAEPPGPPLPLDPPPPPKPIASSLPIALLSLAGALATAGFLGIVWTRRRPTAGLPGGPSPARS